MKRGTGRYNICRRCGRPYHDKQWGCPNCFPQHGDTVTVGETVTLNATVALADGSKVSLVDFGGVVERLGEYEEGKGQWSFVRLTGSECPGRSSRVQGRLILFRPGLMRGFEWTFEDEAEMAAECDAEERNVGEAFDTAYFGADG